MERSGGEPDAGSETGAREGYGVTEQKQSYRTRLVIDLGVPRNVDPAILDLKGVHLYNLDNLQSIIAENMRAREKEAEKAGEIVHEQVDAFIRWYRRQRAIPFISALRQKTEAIRLEKLRQFSGISRLPAKEQEVVDKLTRSLLNSLLKEPIFAMKDISLEEDFQTAERYACRLFGLRSGSKYGI